MEAIFYFALLGDWKVNSGHLYFETIHTFPLLKLHLCGPLPFQRTPFLMGCFSLLFSTTLKSLSTTSFPSSISILTMALSSSCIYLLQVLPSLPIHSLLHPILLPLLYHFLLVPPPVLLIFPIFILLSLSSRIPQTTLPPVAMCSLSRRL